MQNSRQGLKSSMTGSSNWLRHMQNGWSASNIEPRWTERLLETKSGGGFIAFHQQGEAHWTRRD
jgi:hypothetical protein